MKRKISKTTAPVQPGDFKNSVPEFGRTADVQRQFGVRRGSLYNLHKLGKIKGVTLRVCGNKSGVRLWDMASIGNYIREQMAGVSSQ